MCGRNGYGCCISLHGQLKVRTYVRSYVYTYVSHIFINNASLVCRRPASCISLLSLISTFSFLLFVMVLFFYRELHGAPLQPLEFELDDGPAIEALLAAYPEAILVSELPHPSEELEDKIALAQVLYKEGFLLIYDEASKPDNDEDEVDDDNPF